MPASHGERRFQGNLSRDYHLVMRGVPHLAAMDRHVIQALRSARPVHSRRRLEVLEIGCGPGRATAKLLTGGGNLHLTALDNEPGLVRRARQQLKSALQADRLTLVQVDALAFLKASPPNQYDAVVSVLCLHNLEQVYRTQVLREILRVLKPGGLFINADKYPPNDPAEFSRVLQAHMALFLEQVGAKAKRALLQQVILHELADFAPERIMPAQAALDTLSNLGFRNPHFVYRRNFDAVLVSSRHSSSD